MPSLSFFWVTSKWIQNSFCCCNGSCSHGQQLALGTSEDMGDIHEIQPFNAGKVMEISVVIQAFAYDGTWFKSTGAVFLCQTVFAASRVPRSVIRYQSVAAAREWERCRSTSMSQMACQWVVGTWPVSKFCSSRYLHDLRGSRIMQGSESSSIL